MYVIKKESILILGILRSSLFYAQETPHIFYIICELNGLNIYILIMVLTFWAHVICPVVDISYLYEFQTRLLA